MLTFAQWSSILPYFVSLLLSSTSSSHAMQGEKPKQQQQKQRQLLEQRHKTLSKEDIGVESRIIGGQDIGNPNEYQFFARWYDKVMCGATVIHSDILLTAAHCVDNHVRWGPTVYVGSQHISNGMERSIRGISVHPNFNASTVDFDYMILVLDQDLPSSIPMVPLNNDPKHPSMGDHLTIIGFGTIDPHSIVLADTLQEVTVPYVPDEHCYKGYNGIVNNATMLCAGGIQGKDACLGDSGSPLLDENGTQVGITSWGPFCGKEGFPAIYSRVSHVYHWIQEQICYNSNNPPMDTCGGQRLEFTVNITYDDYPDEISWTIQNNDGEIIIYIPSGTTGSEYELQSSRTIHLLPGNYTFEITDTVGNGLCCDYGNGHFSLNSRGNGTIAQPNSIVHDGRFERTVRIHFELSSMGILTTNWTPPIVHEHTLRMDVLYDFYPWEVSWMILNLDTYDLVHYTQYSNAETTKYDSVSVILPDGNYYFLMFDSEFYGICCSAGNGSFTLNEVIKGIDIPILSYAGIFTGTIEHIFDL